MSLHPILVTPTCQHRVLVSTNHPCACMPSGCVHTDRRTSVRLETKARHEEKQKKVDGKSGKVLLLHVR